jgi:hypothetical protein
MSNFKRTEEQDAIVAASKTGEDMVIEAGAGSGKTSTLKEIAFENPTKQYIYLAFNRSVRDEAAQSFPANVKCFTGHQLAMPSHGAPYSHRGSAKRMWANEVARALGIYRPFKITEDSDIAPRGLATIITETVENFCKTADTKITRRHVPPVEIIERGSNAHERLVEYIVPLATQVWDDQCNKNGQIHLGKNMWFSTYLKRWALTNPTLDCDAILYDEAQDANAVIAGVVTSQTCQKIMVGDRAQAIYGWNGAVDAMTKFVAPHRLRLTKSFRFGPQVAERANRWLPFTGSDMQIEGFEAIESVIYGDEPMSDPDAILCRTNAGVIEAAIQQQAAGRKAAIVGGTKEIEMFVKAADRLMSGLDTDHADLIGFKSWSEVQSHAQDEGADIRVLVRLVDNYGTQAILDVCAQSTTEARADVIVSTAHKAKGREWERVRLNGDFIAPKDEDGKVSATEAMLIYVAVTRAKLALDDLAVAWIDRYLTSNAPAS